MIYIVWFMLVFASYVVAAIHIVRLRSRGVVPALAVHIGALLCFAFVSAYIGVYEIRGYTRSIAFAVSLAIGFAGVGMIVWSCRRLKWISNNKKTD